MLHLSVGQPAFRRLNPHLHTLSCVSRAKKQNLSSKTFFLQPNPSDEQLKNSFQHPLIRTNGRLSCGRRALSSKVYPPTQQRLPHHDLLNKNRLMSSPLAKITSPMTITKPTMVAYSINLSLGLRPDTIS